MRDLLLTLAEVEVLFNVLWRVGYSCEDMGSSCKMRGEQMYKRLHCSPLFKLFLSVFCNLHVLSLENVLWVYCQCSFGTAYIAFVIWWDINKKRNRGKLSQRRIFLEQLGNALVKPQTERIWCLPRASTAAAAIVRDIQTETNTLPPPIVQTAGKKFRRCQVCPTQKDSKTSLTCFQYISARSMHTLSVVQATSLTVDVKNCSVFWLSDWWSHYDSQFHKWAKIFMKTVQDTLILI